MFHESRYEEVKQRIIADLKSIDNIGSVRLYLCWYDEYMVAKDAYNGRYPCSNKNVSIYDVIDVVREVFTRPHIILHNVIVSPFPVGIKYQRDSQAEIEKYVEVCLVF